MKPTTTDAYRLLHEGAVAFSQMEENGIRIDIQRLTEHEIQCKAIIKEKEEELRSTDVYKTWRRRFGPETNLGSRDQLGKVLFQDMGLDCPSLTDTGKPKVDEECLKKINLPFVGNYLKLMSIKKLLSTYLGGLRREVEGEYLHPFFSLHTTQTFRSSSQDPNFQNIPIRDPEMSKWIRPCFIARPGHRLVEMDYSAIEVRVAACYHRDPTMIKYIEEGYDLHKDMAAECFLLERENVSKQARQAAKGCFVFAEFYGDFYPSVTKILWDEVQKLGIKTAGGVPILKHLESKGISRLGKCDPKVQAVPGTYEKHIQGVESRFWNERFPVYARWKKKWHSEYKQNGGFDTLTGFHIDGVYKKNDVINYPIQGSAFHCLLWSLIEINRYLMSNGMRSRVVGQIHDSILGDVHESELEEYLKTAKRIMTKNLREHWEWIIVPIDIEADVTPVDGNWHQKAPMAI